jgi:PiT family inorganic phosphate transporter
MLSLLGGIFLGWSLGANDASNVFGSAVASKMMRFWTAAILASVFVVLGALLEGPAGIETLQSLTRLNIELAVVCSVSAAATVTIMTILGLPVSTAHAAVGAILGTGLLNRQLNVSGLEKIVVCWLGTPVGGMVIAVLLYKILGAIYNSLRINLLESDSLMRILLVAAGAYGSYALGANNVANVTAVFVAAGRLDVFSATLIGGLSICLGILTFSRPVMETVGKKLVRLDAFSALIVVLAEAITVHIYALVGVPVSTSQALVGAIIGVGLIKRTRMVSRRTLLNIVIAWVFTPILSSFLAIVLDFSLHLKYVPNR